MKHLPARNVAFAAAGLWSMFLPIPTMAQTPRRVGAEVAITVPMEGEHFVRVLPSKDAKRRAPLPHRFLDRKTRLVFDPSSVGSSPRIAVDDARTGNTTVRGLLEKSGVPITTLDLQRLDFDHVRQVDVRVLYDGRPVQVAEVTLTPSKGDPTTVTIDGTRLGVATFEDVRAGTAKLRVVYGDNLTQTQDVRITTEHAPGPVVVTLAVANSVPTLTAPAGEPARDAQTATPGSPASSPTAGNGFSGIVGLLLGIAVPVAIIYGLFRWSQSGGMAATLKNAGIEVSGEAPVSDAAVPWKPAAPPPPIVADPSACQFCGEQIGAAGSCTCSVTAGASPTRVGAGEARLIGSVGPYAGAIFPLVGVDQGSDIGRDADRAVPLPNDTTVSRRHAVIRRAAASFTVADEGSANGVFVNGARISGPHALRAGDEIQIGATRFRFEV